jgi:TPP-dependent pyruvate/acetoin dehydrogenase alpha subunit
LKREGLLEEASEFALDEEARVYVADAYARAEAEPEPPDDGFFNHIYEASSPRLEEQRAAFKALRGQ